MVLQTKLTPPRLHKRILPRPRLTRRLLEALDYRLTIVQAGAGYGKSTALVAALAQAGPPLVWYHLDSEDADPLVFLLHLVHGFRDALPALSETPLALLEGWSDGGAEPAWGMVVDVLVNELARLDGGAVLLVLDDVHLLSGSPLTLDLLDRLINWAPPDLHIVLSTRYPLALPTLVKWRARGEVLEIGQQELAFTAGEVAALFRGLGELALSDEDVERLAEQTEGWAIALQLVWQRLRASARQGRSTGDYGSVGQPWSRLGQPMESLFSFLAQEVLQRQPPALQEFLRLTSVLRQMTAPLCDRLRDSQDSERFLRHLLEGGLFTVNLGDGHVRYHHLFREFLLQQLSAEEARATHRRAAACYRQQGDDEGAIYHLLAAGALDEAAALVSRLGRGLVRAGRLDTLLGWIDALPPEVLESHPPLLVYLGDIARLRSRFDEALGWYRQAEALCRGRGDVRGLGQALRGQARVYLDTVNPSQAEHLLQEALRLSDGQEDRETRIRLLELLAENRLNLGRLEDAQRFQAQAQELREEGPTEAELRARVLIRTGQLDQARRLLEKWLEIERRQPVLRPRAHRETSLLLALVLAFQGEAEAASRYAEEGIRRGQTLRSPFITAVGYMRQGHALLLLSDPQAHDRACRSYRQAIALADQLSVQRLKVEACWGLCRAYGFRGEIEEALRTASRGLEIAEATGDEWIMALIRLSMGAGLVLAGRYAEAADWLAAAGSAFRECSDTYGETLSRLWQSFVLARGVAHLKSGPPRPARPETLLQQERRGTGHSLAWQGSGDQVRLARNVEELLRLAREHGYDYLFLRRTLLGPPDPRRLVPLLLFARDRGLQRAYAQDLLVRLGLTRLELHPGYQLRVQALGNLRVWRGDQEVLPQEWKREKARQLFLLLLTYRQRLLEREQIVEMLWPSLEPEAAGRDFKVALSTLYRVLEPELEPRSPSAYVVRDGTLYGLRPGADLWLDAGEFERLVEEGDRRLSYDQKAALDLYRQALALYKGDYLEEYPYAEWCSEERERLLTLYLRTAERLAQALVERERWEEAIEICQGILAHDDCWEEAYRLMMLAYVRLGNRTQAVRVFQRCLERLRAELDVAPSPATVELYHTLLHATI